MTVNEVKIIQRVPLYSCPYDECHSQLYLFYFTLKQRGHHSNASNGKTGREKRGWCKCIFARPRSLSPYTYIFNEYSKHAFLAMFAGNFLQFETIFFYYLNRGRIQSSVASIGCRLLSHYLRPLFIIRRILVFPSLIFRQEMHQLLWCELMSFQALHNVRHQDLRFFIIFNADLYANYFPLVIFVYWSFENYGALSSLFYF